VEAVREEEVIAINLRVICVMLDDALFQMLFKQISVLANLVELYQVTGLSRTGKFYVKV